MSEARRLAEQLERMDHEQWPVLDNAARELRRLYDLLGKANARCRIRAEMINELVVLNNELQEKLEKVNDQR